MLDVAEDDVDKRGTMNPASGVSSPRAILSRRLANIRERDVACGGRVVVSGGGTGQCGHRSSPKALIIRYQNSVAR